MTNDDPKPPTPASEPSRPATEPEPNAASAESAGVETTVETEDPAALEMADASTDPAAPEPPKAEGGAARRMDRATALVLAGLALVLILGAYLRFLNVDWDSGHHLHPDERFLTMVQGNLALPTACQAGDAYGCLLGYLDTDTSTLNPRNQGHSFFSYGTWPMTLVHVIARQLGARQVEIAGQIASAEYGSVHLVGRVLSAWADLLAIVLLFVFGWRLYDRRVGLLAAALAAFTAFSIQQAHFFTVDTPANLFVAVFLVAAVGMVHKRRWSETILAGIGMGMAIASKIAMWPLVPAAIIAMAIVAWRRGGTREDWLRFAGLVALLGIVSFTTLRFTGVDMFAGPGWPNVVENPARFTEVTAGQWHAPDWWFTLRDLMPDALEPMLLPDPRWADSMRQISVQVTGHGMDWPPNHQWWNRTDYLFPWRNMVLWGMGLALGLTAWLGWAVGAAELLRRGRLQHLLPWLWVTLVFLYYGGQWGKTMRYFLPIYPALTVLAAYTLVAFWDWTRRRPLPASHAEAGGRASEASGERPEAQGASAAPRDRASAISWERLRVPALGAGLIVLVVGFTFVWAYAFSRIYSREHSRVLASRWIYHNLPTAFGLTVAPTGADPVPPVNDERFAGNRSDDGRLQGPGRFMPVSVPDQTVFESGSNAYWVEADGWFGPGRVLVPGESPVTIDGLQLNYLTDPEGDAGPERVRAVLSGSPFPGPDGAPEDILAEGEAEARLDADEPGTLRVPLPPTELAPEGEYYVWFEIEGAPIRGRPAILAHHTRWDDYVPMGIEGYAAYDDPTTSYAEGLFGSSQLELYDTDSEAKLDAVLDTLEDSDYTLATSNRVYGSVAQMPTRYPMTIALFDKLFGEADGFRHVADLHSYPSLGPLEVNDQPAEEAWHVYDHPRVDIWAVDGMDRAALRAALLPLTGPDRVTFDWNAETGGGGASGGGSYLSRLLARLRALVGMGEGAAGATEPTPPEALLLSPERRAAEEARADYVFDPDSLINRQPALALVLWYLVQALVGLLAFPILASVLRNLPDRGWAVARAAGLLITSWLAWLVASLGWADHSPALVWAAALAMGAVSAILAWRGRTALATWLRRNRRLIAIEELVFLAIFALFLVIRMGNPDLWHPSYGGEKPMDLAYLNAVLRTTSFPPFDPWFAGGSLNYYYYGFVFIGALMEMTGIMPWISYNLAIPSLAAMTGLGVFGVAYNWVRAGHRRMPAALGAGGLAALLAVVSGNLYQVPFILSRPSDLVSSSFESAVPGLETLVRSLQGWGQVLRGAAALNVSTGHWYWNASRAIPDQGEVAPITEFPFFTFLYADLHAHMMALPITVLALTVALSWAVLTREEAEGYNWPLEPWGLGRLLLGALAVGALWPANTWDYPTYGLVAAGGIAAGQWQRLGGPGWRWLVHVALRGLLLLALSLLFFLPYHRAYVTPYASFRPWDSVTTPLSAYLIVHGIFLFAITSWMLLRLAGALRDPAERRRVALVLAVAGVTLALLLGGLWLRSAGKLAASAYPPSPWTPLFAGILLTLGIALLLRPRAAAPERFATWIVVLGLGLTLFVEYVVLDGDIGRMNTVFKFYIQIWVLWATLAAVSVAWIGPALRWAARGPGRAWAGLWRLGFAALVAAGLVYPITAGRAKIRDRFPAAFGLEAEELEDYEARNHRAGLSGAAFMDYGAYDEAQPGGANRAPLRFRYDRDAFLWLLRNVRGSPTILEAYNINGGYRWGSRYSIHTGLPAVIGWDWHQKQQRNAVGHWVVDERTRDVAEIYDTTDLERARALLEQYGVRYVIVGEQERIFYDPAGLAKFDRMVEEGLAERVYPEEAVEDPPVIIYRLPEPRAEAAR